MELDNSSVAFGTPPCQSGTETISSPPDTTRKRPEATTDTNKVLILDGNTRSALAVTRSLGSKGVHVVVADAATRSLAGASRYCRDRFTYASPASNLEGFLSGVKSECSQRRIGVLLPVTELTTSIVLKHRQEFASVRVPYAEWKAFDALTDKWRLLKLAQGLNISIPKTEFVSEVSSITCLCRVLTFPVVMKPYRSMIPCGGRWIPTSVHYARSPEELKQIVARYEYFNEHPFLIQEYVSGRAEGVFALYDDGEPVAFFAHRRLREKPPWGGVSVLSESIRPNPEAQRMAQVLLDYVGWHGVAMVEFKVSSTGIPYLMEVNGRFWGSLQLAIDAGVDFPWLLYQLAIAKDLGEVQPYIVGVKSRWLLGDFARLWKVLVNEGSSPYTSASGKVRSILEFLNFSQKGPRYDVNRLDDLLPFLLELTQSFTTFRSAFFKRMAKNQHRFY